MPPQSATISRLTPNSPEIGLVADWRHDQWFRDEGFTRAQTHDQLRQFVEAVADGDGGHEIALVARLDGVPAGTCLLVREEINPHHDVTPWLAGLYVEPQFRSLGIGSDLVRAIECHGRSRGVQRLYLYTDRAEPFYGRLGWGVAERFSWHGEPFVLMQKDL